MRKKRIVLIFVFFLGLLFTYKTEATALEFSTEPYSNEKKTAFADAIGLELLLDENNEGSILCFDVRQDGTYALAFGNTSQYRIYVYDAGGTFLYGYKFSYEGIFGIQFCTTNDPVGLRYSTCRAL